MKHLEELLEWVNSQGYMAQVTLENCQYGIAICHSDWITDDIHKSVVLPSGKSQNWMDAFEIALHHPNARALKESWWNGPGRG